MVSSEEFDSYTNEVANGMSHQLNPVACTAPSLKPSALQFFAGQVISGLRCA
ncbi:hypothetical protein [Burkholderia sp. IT-111MI5]|uniref:hypothetical protein n=1 Tax=Burkholderia sp. IT-111MI5 TaxID=3026439 RepID=UPI0026A7EF57|nr:hypothetical protein [Burkholderia pyrrocinia]